jgi:hypothetical protein
VRIFGPWTGKLNNDEERITLKDKNGITVCTVKYGSRAPWPVAADGGGHALVLLDPNRRVDDWRNWTASTRPDGDPGSAPLPNFTSPVPRPEIEANLGKVLIDYGAVWRYSDTIRNLGTQWREPDYDDRDWRQGPGLLGYDIKPLPKPGLKTPVNFGRQMTYYFRLNFNYPGGAKPGDRLLIDQIVDDGVVYYLNGKEIARSRMPPGAINYLTQASSTVPDATEEIGEFALDESLLNKGANGRRSPSMQVHQFGYRFWHAPAADTAGAAGAGNQ